MTDGVDYCKTCFHPKADHLFNGFDANASCGLQECECVDYVYGETRVTSATGASKGTKQARYDLIPVPALDLLARLYGKGAEKYDEHNWRLGYDWSKSYSAAQRHLNAFWAGEDLDPETGVPHPINVAFHMFALTTYLTEHPELDDRFETRGRRSDSEIEESEETDQNVFFKVMVNNDHNSPWYNSGYYRSLENAEARRREILEQYSGVANLAVDIVEESFKDG